ncbi:MAG: Ig-like domain-containing protein, partial [Lachnospiraceae bacterium]|nr:Ig-like domain-containing protein [Lachnospiraceae bacterium]
SKSITVNVSSYNLTGSGIGDFYLNIINRHPEFFFLKNSITYSGTDSVTYETDTENYGTAAITAFKNKADFILGGIAADWSPLQKLIYLHNYIVQHTDYAFKSDGTTPDDKYNAYNCLVEKRAVCQGYSLAFKYLAERAGIECDYISSKNLNHGWNMVSLGGKNYYIDCTWDDPVGCPAFFCVYKNFLKSKAAFSVEHDKTDWVNTNKESVYSLETGSDYDTGKPWNDMECAFPLTGNIGFYYEYDGSKTSFGKYDFSTMMSSKIIEKTFSWSAGGGYFYTGYFGGLGAVGSDMVIAGPDEIFIIGQDGSQKAKISLTDAQKAKGDIYSMMADDEGVHYALGSGPNAASSYIGLLDEYKSGREIPDPGPTPMPSGDTSVEKIEKDNKLEEVAAGEKQGGLDPVPLVTVSTSTLLMVKGQKFALSENDWKSGNSKIVTVKKGAVTAKKAGETVLTRKDRTIRVTVVKPSVDKKLSLVAGFGKKITLNNSNGLKTVWVSSAPDIASVLTDGTVYGIAKGNATITAYINGVGFNTKVTVKDADTSKRDFSKTVELVPMQSVNIKIAGFSPKKATWSSDRKAVSSNKQAKNVVYDNGIVRITKSGKMTAIGAGETTLTGKVEGKGDVKIKVHVADTTVKTLHVNLNSSKPLKMYKTSGILPWTVSGSDIVTLNPKKNKVLAGQKTGETYLKAKYEGFEYKVKIYIEDPSLITEGVTGKHPKYALLTSPGKTTALKTRQVYQNLLFKSSNNNVAYVDGAGILYARDKGTANVITKINGKTVKIKVKVQ